MVVLGTRSLYGTHSRRDRCRFWLCQWKGDTTNYQLLHATDHAETVKVTYDPNKISLDKLLQYYFRVIGPTSINKQGNDRGRQYRTGIYYQNEQDKAVIEAALKTLQSKYQEPIQIEVEPLKNYVEAEEYHQDYLKKTRMAIAISTSKSR